MPSATVSSSTSLPTRKMPATPTSRSTQRCSNDLAPPSSSIDASCSTTWTCWRPPRTKSKRQSAAAGRSTTTSRSLSAAAAEADGTASTHSDARRTKTTAERTPKTSSRLRSRPDALKYVILRDKIGLGILEPLIHDPNIEDISCSGLGQSSSSTRCSRR